MTNGTVLAVLSKCVSKELYNGMLACAVMCLVVWSPFSAAATTATEVPAKPQAEVVLEKVNINQANAETIAQVMSGIGLKKAEAIVAYRNAKGKFTSVEQLLEVKGIGESTLKKNKGKIVI